LELRAVSYVVIQALVAVQSALLALVAFTEQAQTATIWEVVALSLFQGFINAFDMQARQAFLVEMIERREDLPNAIALNSSLVNEARLVGPSVAGLLIAVAGEGWCFLVDAISYLAVIAALLAMASFSIDRPPLPSSWARTGLLLSAAPRSGRVTSVQEFQRG